MSEVEDRLDRLTDQLGVTVVESHNLTTRLNACYLPETNTIYVRKGLDPATRACAVAHELGHMHFGHTCSSPRFERAADVWAAKQLLDGRVTIGLVREYRDAPSALAAELGVTPRLLQLWFECGVFHGKKFEL